MDSLPTTTSEPITTAAMPREAGRQMTPSCCPTASFSPAAVRPWMRDRRVLAGAGLAVAGSGLALGWGWLTAAGVAPLIVSAAPCLLMCVLGLCMRGRGHQMSSVSPASPPDEPTSPPHRAELR